MFFLSLFGFQLAQAADKFMKIYTVMSGSV